MQDPMPYLDRLLEALLVPASIYGAGGALLHSVRQGRPIWQTLLSVVGGVFTSNMLGPLIREQTPENWHYSLFFLAGWGGLELVAKCYDLGVCALEKYVNRKVDPGNGA